MAKEADPEGGAGVMRFSIPGKRKSDAARLASVADRITVGSARSSDLSIDDPVASDEHCVLTFKDGRFFAEDANSSTGTYLNGLSVQAPVEIAEGDSLVLGVSRITFKIETSDAGPTLVMSLAEKSFYFVEKGKPAKNGKKRTLADLYQWVRSEVVFGRSRMLTWGNFAAGGLTLVLFGVVFAASVREPLSDPGHLHASHQMLFDEGLSAEQRDLLNASYPDALTLATAQGCDVCHSSFGGTPAEKCAQCHGDIVGEQQHPGLSAGLSDPQAWWADTGCVRCHTDHTRDAAWDFIPSVQKTQASCGECHAEDRHPAGDMPIAPVEGQRQTSIAYNDFSHADHLKRVDGGAAVACSLCHVEVTEGAGVSVAASLGRNFAPADYDVCTRCHIAGQVDASIPEEFLPVAMTLAWHGTDDGEENCTQCHAELYQDTLATVELQRAVNQLFSLPTRVTHGEFIKGHVEFEVEAAGSVEACIDCHRDSNVTPQAIPAQPFLHGLHLSELQPATPADARRLSAAAGECLSCHQGIDQVSTLSGDAFAGAEGQCADCHTNGVPAAFREPASLDTAVEFPHDVHTRAFSTSKTLEMGCFACHEFAESDLFAAEISTNSDAQSCMDCHAKHNNMAGAVEGCAVCHEVGVDSHEGSYWGKTISKKWPAANTFDHFSTGHAAGAAMDLTGTAGCTECHAVDGLWDATSILDVTIPTEAQAECRECHVNGKQRFHWR
ncbi:MAG: pSer/pThr/pTyr-binding forkhead associated (FHA) protein [Planctomycetota bacterium]|jgi:pSer/pThr/pTyr-binding forkhead associated (FHA) protein